MTQHPLVWEEVVRQQPLPRRIPTARSSLRAAHARDRRILAVLDDDPTGTQTVGDVPVYFGLNDSVKHLKVRPAFVVAKGGITSHCLAVERLAASRARVLGQIMAGVPVWELGAGSKWEGVSFVVFPGNVGGPDAVAKVVASLAKSNANTL
jgi:uncharacterized protein YgbK (DUF1537 family)